MSVEGNVIEFFSILKIKNIKNEKIYTRKTAKHSLCD